MVVVFLKRLCLTRDGEWVTVSLDLNDGLDLNGIDAATFRINESLPVAQAEAGDGRMRLRFQLSEVRSLFRESMKLTISGSLDDGVQVLGYLTDQNLASVVQPSRLLAAGAR